LNNGRLARRLVWNSPALACAFSSCRESFEQGKFRSSLALAVPRRRFMPLFIIFGINSSQKAKTAGQFQCPVCGAPRNYSEIRTGRYFSLFFIPLIPLGSSRTGRVVCNQCGTEFDSDVVH